MLTGTRPFRGDTTVSIISSIIKDTQALTTELNPALPANLDRIIRRCLAKDVAHRYQSALGLRNDLEEMRREARGNEAVAARVSDNGRSVTWPQSAGALGLRGPIPWARPTPR